MGMNLSICLDLARADQRGGWGVGTYWNGVHGSCFWVDPVSDIVVIRMAQ
jgi:CubicO group peptidase (beta-lactamase class C family)